MGLPVNDKNKSKFGGSNPKSGGAASKFIAKPSGGKTTGGGAAKKPVFIIYFYSNEGDCPDCIREGYVLTRLKEIYPDLRVYSFDYNLDLSAIDSMKKIYKIKDALPVLVIEDTTYTGFKTIEELTELLPSSLKATTTTLTATTTKRAK